MSVDVVKVSERVNVELDSNIVTIISAVIAAVAVIYAARIKSDTDKMITQANKVIALSQSDNDAVSTNATAIGTLTHAITVLNQELEDERELRKNDRSEYTEKLIRIDTEHKQKQHTQDLKITHLEEENEITKTILVDFYSGILALIKQINEIGGQEPVWQPSTASIKFIQGS